MMSAIEKLAHLFTHYDKKQEAFLEYVKREGQDSADHWPHVDVEGRPE